MNINILKLKNLTLFNKNSTTNTNLIIYNNKQIIYFINYYNYLNQALKLKNVYLEHITFYLIGKNLLINLNIYYNSLKLLFLKKKSKFNLKINKTKQIINIKTKNNLFPKNFIKYNKITNITLKITNLNKSINIQKSLILYKYIKNAMLILLKKKRYLLIDLIRITTLLIDNKINIKLFTIFIGQIFSTLSKKSHNRFFLSLKKLFNIIINNSTLNSNHLKIKGIKLKINGKLRGKPRSDIKNITVGTVPLQSNSKHIEHFKQHIFTIYGAFGLKLWLYRNNTK